MKDKTKRVSRNLQIETRKISRNKLKKYFGSNKIQRAWQHSQINKYGAMPFVTLLNRNSKPNSHWIHVLADDGKGIVRLSKRGGY